MALLLHYTGQDYISRGLLKTELTPGSTSAFADGCKTGKGFAFDGTANGPLTIPPEFSRPDLLSISFWCKASNNTGFKVMFSTGIENVYAQYPQYGRHLVRIVNSRVGVLYFRTDGTYVDRSVPADVLIWNHVTVTFSETAISIYINGILANSTAIPITGNLRPDWKPYIGCMRNSDGVGYDFMNGQICNFKLYNHVLSAREVAEDYKSLMLHYKLDKPITTQVFDHSGFNRHIAVIENTTTNSTTEKRVYGGSLANDGTKSLYGSLNLSELNGINEISIALRFRFVSQTNIHSYFLSRTAVTAGYGISIFKGGGTSRDFYIDLGVRNTFTLSYDLVTGTWYDLVAVKSPTDVKLYINGVLVDTLLNTNSLSDIGQLYASIGRSLADDNLTPSNAMNGNVQDIRFYAKALTQEDVTELYQTRHMVDKDSNCYTYELIEGQSGVGMNKQGQLLCDEIIENEDGTFQIVNNETIKTKEFKEI